MFEISTRLVRAGRDTNVYRWADKDPMFAAALLGALSSVLGTAMHSGDGAKGPKAVTLQLTVTCDGAPWIDAPITLASLSDEDERAVMSALSAAVRPYRDAAVRAKA